MYFSAFLILIVVIVVALVSLYNRLIRLRIHTEEAWADIDVQLKRRYDLIPNLVETVKGYAGHERETLKEVLEARAKATAMNVQIDDGAAAIQSLAGAEAGLSGALGRLFALAENYPDLKANENFAKLQDEITDTENKIQAARRFYNSTIKSYMTSLQSFPTNLFASLFGFAPRDFFELPENSEQREPVAVDFSS